MNDIPPENEQTIVIEVDPRPTSLGSILRTPTTCPITICRQQMGITSVLSHFFKEHGEVGVGAQVEFHELPALKRLSLLCDIRKLKYQQNCCWGIVAYRGLDKDGALYPAERGICTYNSSLTPMAEHLRGHLPVLIMGCITSFGSMLAETSKDFAHLVNPEDKNQHLLVIWLVSVETTQPIYGTVTAYDKIMTSSRSAMMEVRNLRQSQNPAEFLAKEMNILRLNCGDINILTRGYQEPLYLEVVLQEYDYGEDPIDSD